MQTRLYEVYVQDQKGLSALGAGWRSLFARQGHKWVSVFDWTTLTTCRVLTSVWKSMRPRELGTKDGYRSERVRQSILAKLDRAGRDPRTWEPAPREPTKFEQDCIEACTW